MIVMNSVANYWGLQLLSEQSFSAEGWEMHSMLLNNQECEKLRNKESGRFYRHEWAAETAEKVFWLIILVPLVELPLTIAYNLAGAAMSLRTPSALKAHLWNIARAPVYALSIVAIAISSVIAVLRSGMSAGYVASAYIGQLEKKWGNQTPLSEDFGTLLRKAGLSEAMKKGKTWYLAPCFQELVLLGPK